MMAFRLSACVVLIVALTVAQASSAQAKGPPIVAIGLSGPGIAKEIQITDEDTLYALMDAWWSDLVGVEPGWNAQPRPIDQPVKPLGEGFVLTRYQQAESGSKDRVALDQLRYFPSRNGTPGYTFFVGSLTDQYDSAHDGRWFRATQRGDVLMRQVFERFKINIAGDANLPALSEQQRAALIRSFVAAFNAGDVGGALAVLSEDATVKDCDYAKAGAASFESRDEIRTWLRTRAADRDQLTLAATPMQIDKSYAALSPVAAFKLDKRASKTLAGLGFKRGVQPQTPAHVAFDPAAQRISALWLAPFDPDQAHLCWKFRSVK